ncbi:hypothetical protein KDX40_04860 [Burkholderia ambifaria]|uniref:hypothetical protein n=1 Tax=Burkholderia ambifaria TaxID=152480 RepID=UPI001B9F2B2C|nr:hypothetical protein [Burkholderia ambifaria]MBR8343068.1 hypothetical protein [Burkholderia ambifaria]
MSDVVATTQTGAVDTESAFQGLWDSGAFDPNGIPPKEGNEGTGTAAQNAQQGAQAVDAQGQAQQQAEGEQGQEGQQAQQQEEAPAYESLDALLTALKVDPTSALKLNVTTKIDGVETKVPLEQVLKSYQLEGHVNNKSIELSNQRVQFEQQQNAWRQANQQAIQQHQQMANVAMQMLNHDFNRIDWNTLRAQNPAEFAALQAEFGQRQQQIQGFLQNVQMQQQQEAQQQQFVQQQTLAQEHAKLMQAVPEWRDPATFAKSRDQISQYARNVGFQDAELNQIFDHRYMRILHDAARYQALQAAAPQALRQVRQAPTMVAPGSRTEVNPTDARRQAAVDRFNRNPRDEDAQAAVFSLFSD